MHGSAIYAAAYAFAASYSTVYDLYRNGSSPQQLADHVASYYRTPYTAFYIGQKSENQTRKSIADGTIVAYNFFENAGIGSNVTADSFRVEPVSDASAIVWIDWRIHPKNEIESFTWTTMYGYRTEENVLAGIEAPGEIVRARSTPNATGECGTSGALTGGWEFGMTDDAIVNFSKRVPNYMDSYVVTPSKK